MADVSLDHVTKRYGKKVVAVDQISFDCADGEFVAILGPSGCGKSSTMRMIAGLEEVTSGTVSIGGLIVNRVSSADRNVAMAFENFGLYPHRTVFGNIAYPLRLRGVDEDGIVNRVVEIATILGIENSLGEFPRQLSVGTTQRVSLARALVRKPTVFLMDEPLSHLDADLRGHMQSELKRLHILNGSTSVYVTHDQLEAMSMADRIVVMNGGMVQQVGTPAAIYSQPANTFVATFIGEPPMNMLDGRIVRGREGTVIFVDDTAVLTLSGPLLAAMESAFAGLDAIKVGVRPDDFVIVPTGSNGLSGTVRVREILGRSSLLSVHTTGHRLRMRVERDEAPPEGDPVSMMPRPDRVHLFHPTTGVRITTGT